MTILGANEAVIEQLVLKLKAEIEELNDVFLEFPNYQEEMEMPCASVLTSGNVNFTPQMPILISNEDGVSKYATGFYDLTISIDLWTSYKQTRGDLVEKIFDLFSKDFQETGGSLGLSLALENYHGTVASYTLQGYNYIDNEGASQRDEWRANITCLANFQRITEKVETVMTDIQLHHEVSETEDNDTDEITVI